MCCSLFRVLSLQVVSVGLEAEIKTSFMQYAMSIILVSEIDHRPGLASRCCAVTMAGAMCHGDDPYHVPWLWLAPCAVAI